VVGRSQLRVPSPAALALFGLCLLFSFSVHLLGAIIGASGFNDDIDLQPERLWNIRNSEIELSTRRLIRWVLPRLGVLAKYVEFPYLATE
jgi:hypothetical protein